MEGIEALIMASLNLKPQMLSTTLWKYSARRKNSPDRWQVLQNGFIKLNFYGASKGNPGQAGIGGIFRNSHGEACRVYAMNWVMQLIMKRN